MNITRDARRSIQQPLPIELVMQILECLPDKTDLAHLCLVTKTFNSIALPLLYRRLELSGHGYDSISLKQQYQLFETLKNPRLSDLVISVNVILSKLPLYSSTSKHSQVCNCDGYDELLGGALSALERLRVLEFDCNMCRTHPESGISRHNYLFTHMRTTQLQQFTLLCRCVVPYKGVHMPVPLLEVSFMKTVTSLAWSCSPWWLRDNKTALEKALCQPEVLPGLRVLGCNIFSNLAAFLRARPITHLYVEYPHKLAEQILQSGRKLEGLLTGKAQDWLPTAIGNNPDLYVNLTLVGAISLETFEIEDVLQILDPFAPLLKLDTLELSYEPEPSPALPGAPSEEVISTTLPPNAELMRLVAMRHPSLRRILIQRQGLNPLGYGNEETVIWELKDGIWLSRNTPRIGQWKLLNGGFDSI